MEQKGIVLSDRGLVQVTGEEAPGFLQGLITNDINLVDEETAIYAALLTPQGKFLHDFIVVRWDQGYLIDTHSGRAADLLRRLTMYRLRAKIDIEDVSKRVSVAAIIGEDAIPAAPEDTRLIQDPRHAALGHRLYIRGDATSWLKNQNVSVDSHETYEQLRVTLGVPDGSKDIPIERAFPLEYGFDALHAVSYDKGCFVGQELTARTHNRGKIKKGLFRITLKEGSVEPGTPLLDGGASVGEVLSGSGSIALAHLRFDAVENRNQLTAGAQDVVEVIPAPLKLND